MMFSTSMGHVVLLKQTPLLGGTTLYILACTAGLLQCNIVIYLIVKSNIKAVGLAIFDDILQYYTGAVQLYLPVYTKLFILARVSASGGPRDPYLY